MVRHFCQPMLDKNALTDSWAHGTVPVEEEQKGRREVVAIVLQGNLAELWLGDGANDHALGGHVPAHGGPHVNDAAGPVVGAVEEALVGQEEVDVIDLVGAAGARGGP